MQQKVAVFTEQAQTRKTIFPTLITTFGVKKNEHFTGRVQAEVTLSDLFTGVDATPGTGRPSVIDPAIN